MIKKTAAQKRLLQNATLIVATRLVFRELRQHFPIRQLSDAMTIFNGQALRKSDRVIDGEYDVYGSGGKVGQFSDFLSDKPFVVIGRKGSAGKPTYAPNGGWVIDTAYYAQPSNEDVDTKFLFYALTSLDFADDIISTAIPGINQTAIYRYDIPIPPLELQIKIKIYLDAVENKTTFPKLPNSFIEVNHTVERVESLIARIAKAQSLREEAIIATESLLASNRSTLFTDLELRFPNETLGNLIQMTSGENLTSENLDDSFSYSVYGGGGFVGKYNQYLFEDSKIAIGRVGARCGCIYITDPKSWVTDNALVVTNFSEKLDMQYLYNALTYLDLRKHAKQAAQPVVSQKGINPQTIPVPPLDEQRRIVAYLDSVQARLASLRELQSATGEELGALLPSVLDRAFKGEL